MPRTKWWVNARGAKSVSYDSESAARRAARSVQGASVSKNKPQEGGILKSIGRMIKGGTGRGPQLPRGHR